MSQFVPFSPATAPPPISTHYYRQCKPSSPVAYRRYNNPRITAMLKPDTEPLPTVSIQPLLRVPPPRHTTGGAFPCRLSATPDTTLLPPNKMALTAEEYAALPNYLNIPRPALQLLSEEERQQREGEGLLDLPGDTLDWDTLLGAGKDLLLSGARKRIYSTESGYGSRDQLISTSSEEGTGSSSPNSTSEETTESSSNNASETEEDEWEALEEILSTAVTVSSVSELEEEGSNDATFWEVKRQIGDIMKQEVSLKSVTNDLAQCYVNRLPILF